MLRSTRTPIPNILALALSTKLITSFTDPPVVITSSTISTFSSLVKLKPLLITIVPFFLSEKIVRQPSCVPTSVPKTIPPIAGEITTSGFIPSNSSAIIIEKAVRYSGYCKTFAH